MRAAAGYVIIITAGVLASVMYVISASTKKNKNHLPKSREIGYKQVCEWKLRTDVANKMMMMMGKSEIMVIDRVCSDSDREW